MDEQHIFLFHGVPEMNLSSVTESDLNELKAIINTGQVKVTLNVIHRLSSGERIHANFILKGPSDRDGSRSVDDTYSTFKPRRGY